MQQQITNFFKRTFHSVEVAAEHFDVVQWYSDSNKMFNPDGWAICDMLTWTDEYLEQRHDYIQFAFPLMEPSPFNSNAPVLTSATVKALRSSHMARINMANSFDRMLKFYGFVPVSQEQIASTRTTRIESDAFGGYSFPAESLINTTIRVSSSVDIVEPHVSVLLDVKPCSKHGLFQRAYNFRARRDEWGTGFDHNHLRMTRIIKSLHLFGHHDLAIRFYDTLLQVHKDFPQTTNDRTLKFWKDARNYVPNLEE